MSGWVNGCYLPEVFTGYLWLQYKNKIFQLSKFGAKCQILIFEGTSTLAIHQVKFEEVQIINIKQGIFEIK